MVFRSSAYQCERQPIRFDRRIVLRGKLPEGMRSELSCLSADPTDDADPVIPGQALLAAAGAQKSAPLCQLSAGLGKPTHIVTAGPESCTARRAASNPLGTDNRCGLSSENPFHSFYDVGRLGDDFFRS